MGGGGDEKEEEEKEGRIGKWMRGSQWLGGAAAVRGIHRLRAQINIISTVLTGSRAERSGAAGGPTHRKLFTLLVRER